MKQSVQDYRRELAERTTAIETQVINIYHDLKEVKELLQVQNSRLRTNEQAIAKWKGYAAGILWISGILAWFL
jgi:hypothetical protein